MPGRFRYTFVRTGRPRPLKGGKSLISRIHSAIEVLTLSISLIGVLVVVWGVLQGIAGFLYLKTKGRRRKEASGIEENKRLRRELGAHLLLGLEIFIAADIISSVVSPSWDKVGILAVIVVIRTILSYFLEVELKQTV